MIPDYGEAVDGRSRRLSFVQDSLNRQLLRDQEDSSLSERPSNLEGHMMSRQQGQPSSFSVDFLETDGDASEIVSPRTG